MAKRSKNFKGKRELMLFNPVKRRWLYDTFTYYEIDKLLKDGWRVWN